MAQVKTMTIEEKLAISNKSIALERAGDIEGSDRLMKSIPLPPYLAKIAKEKVGTDYLITSGWNLSEAEAEFGKNWLSR
jgi:hypothetical protein